MNWDSALQKAFSIIEGEEKNKRQLWKISYLIRKEFGGDGLREFADSLKDTFGISRSYNTLRQYAYIYEMTVDYDIPDDIAYTTIRAILSSKYPLKYIRKIQSGASGPEIMRLLLEEKPPVTKHVKCPRCKKTLYCECEKDEKSKNRTTKKSNSKRV